MLYLIYISIISALCNWNFIYESINCGFKLSNFELLKLQGGLFITSSFKSCEIFTTLWKVNASRWKFVNDNKKAHTCRKSKKVMYDKSKILFALTRKERKKLPRKIAAKIGRKLHACGIRHLETIFVFFSIYPVGNIFHGWGTAIVTLHL